MPDAAITPAATGADAARIAAAWFARLAAAPKAHRRHEEGLPARPAATLAAFAALALAEGRTLLILVPDDDLLAELSNALELATRPLCLVLPAADFAARIALRATFSLLKSRLWRDGGDRSAPWARQRRHIAGHPDLWRTLETWAAQDDHSDCPPAVAELFPVRILPLAACRALPQEAADITLLYCCEAPPGLLASASRLLRIGVPAAPDRRHGLAGDDADARLLLERAQLGRDIADLELELATVQAEVGEFTRDYYRRVGRRMAELDALQARQARAAARRAPGDAQAAAAAAGKQRQAEQSAHESRHFTDGAADDAPAFRPGDAVKRLFRQIAQRIHPDRAGDDADRAWRTRLMSEANRAYRHGDERALHEVAALWAEGSAARADAGATPTPTLRCQVERLRARLREIEGEMHRLFGSRLYELFIAARQAGRQGRDLLGEMADQLDASIAELRQGRPADCA